LKTRSRFTIKREGRGRDNGFYYKYCIELYKSADEKGGGERPGQIQHVLNSDYGGLRRQSGGKLLESDAGEEEQGGIVFLPESDLHEGKSTLDRARKEKDKPGKWGRSFEEGCVKSPVPP